MYPGDRIGDWIVVARLGDGARSTVYRCYRKDDRNVVAAVKVTPDDDIADRAAYARTAGVLQAIHHPSIATVYGWGHDPARGAMWIAMDLVDGHDLAQLLGVGAMDPADAVALFIEVADALARLHAEGLVHGDVKPASVMVTRAGAPILVGFDLAPSALSPDALPYAAPEVLRAACDDGAKADQYSLGALLFETLSGVEPAEARGAADDESLDPGGQVPGPLRNIVQRMTSPFPDRRFRDLNAVRDRLKELRIERRRGPKEPPPEIPTTRWVPQAEVTVPPTEAPPPAPTPSPTLEPVEERTVPPPAEAEPPPPTGGVTVAVGCAALAVAGLIGLSCLGVAGGAWWWLQQEEAAPPSPIATPAAPDPAPVAAPTPDPAPEVAPEPEPTSVPAPEAPPPPTPRPTRPRPAPPPAPVRPVPAPAPDVSHLVRPEPRPDPIVNELGEVLLTIETRPPGAEVTVNGDWAGSSPVRFYVSPGTKRVRLKHPDEGREAETLQVDAEHHAWCYVYATRAWTRGACP